MSNLVTSFIAFLQITNKQHNAVVLTVLCFSSTIV